LGYALFDTPIGACAVIWGGMGLVGTQLPMRDRAETRARVLERFPSARRRVPPPDVARAVAAMVALLRGESAPTLTDVALDWRAVTPFRRRVYDAARRVPPGQVRTYGEVAAQIH